MSAWLRQRSCSRRGDSSLRSRRALVSPAKVISAGHSAEPRAQLRGDLDGMACIVAWRTTYYQARRRARQPTATCDHEQTTTQPPENQDICVRPSIVADSPRLPCGPAVAKEPVRLGTAPGGTRWTKTSGGHCCRHAARQAARRSSFQLDMPLLGLRGRRSGTEKL
jgi:hypothetical protein